MATLISATTNALRGLSPQLLNADRFGPDHAPRLRAERSEAVLALAPLLMVVNIVIAALCVSVFYTHTSDVLLIGWLCVVGTIAGYGLYAAHMRDPARQPSGSIRSQRRIVMHAALLASMWTYPPLVLLPIAEGYQGQVLVGVMAGMMAGGAFALAPIFSAAMTWLAITTLANGLAFVTLGEPITFGLAFATVVWSLVIAHNVLRLAISETERFGEAVSTREQGEALEKQRDELAEHRDVIELLLEEYEADGGDWRWRTDKHGILLRAPKQLLTILGLTESDLKEVDCFRYVITKSLPESFANIEGLRQRVATRSRFTEVLVAVRDERAGYGNARWISLSAKPQWTASGEFDGYRGIAADVTARQEAEKRVLHFATHDAMTGLKNREALAEKIDALIAVGRNFAYAQIDLDRFKQCNDRLGHQAGDELLCRVADLLCEAAQETLGRDAMIARIGGDEFAVVSSAADETTCAERIEAFAQRIVWTVGEPHKLTEGVASIGASVGTAIFPRDAQDAEELAKCADLALYDCKGKGRGRWIAYTPEMGVDQRRNAEIENDLHHAVSRGEMRLVYQPIVSLASQRTMAMEALLRWRHPIHGDVPPSTFIPIAEESGVIHALGVWVLQEACQEAVRWADGERLTINVSPKQLSSDEFVSEVAIALSKAGLPPSRLEIEIGEIALLRDVDGLREAIGALRAMGVSIALDDFGTGYRSLACLRDLNFTRVKIDRSFIAALASDDAGMGAFVKPMLELARTMGVETTAEGVEHADQIEMLRVLGCTDAQGYLLGRPGAASAAVRTRRIDEAPRARDIRVRRGLERKVA